MSGMLRVIVSYSVGIMVIGQWWRRGWPEKAESNFSNFLSTLGRNWQSPFSTNSFASLTTSFCSYTLLQKNCTINFIIIELLFYQVLH